MMFLQVPPDTSNYMIAGYAVIFTVLFLYLASLALRFRNTRRDIELLEDLERQENEPAPAARNEGPEMVRK